MARRRADQVDLLELLLEVQDVEDHVLVCRQLHERGVTTITRFAALSAETLREWDIDDYYVHSALSHARQLLLDSSRDLAAIRQQLLVRARMHYTDVCDGVL